MGDLRCIQLASDLKGGPLMWMMPMHVNQKSDYDDDDDVYIYSAHMYESRQHFQARKNIRN